ncbi:hypothetical protein CRP603_gp70 [Roseobacter phage CRP-603]|nr:hypothetical protein CRP603_gp70 [Roseobacter phage CRP-603]
MTLLKPGKPSRKKSVWGHNTSTTTEDVYVCPANCVAEVSFIHIHNSTGNTSIDIEWYVAADTYTSHFLEGKNLGAGEYVTFADIELVLAAGDKIQVTPDTAAHIDTILTVTETFVPVG